MPYQPTRKLFQELSAACGVADRKSAMRFYYGFLKYLIRELSETGPVYLPEFGHFKLRRVKAKKYFNVHKQAMDIAPECTRIVFRPAKRMKEHFRNVEIINKRKTKVEIEMERKERKRNIDNLR